MLVLGRGTDSMNSGSTFGALAANYNKVSCCSCSFAAGQALIPEIHSSSISSHIISGSSLPFPFLSGLLPILICTFSLAIGYLSQPIWSSLNSLTLTFCLFWDWTAPF